VDELAVCSGLYYSAVSHHDDSGGVFNCAQPVGDGDCRYFFQLGLKVLENVCLCLGIKRAC
jgi:hypothetical protein